MNNKCNRCGAELEDNHFNFWVKTTETETELDLCNACTRSALVYSLYGDSSFEKFYKLHKWATETYERLRKS